MDIDTEINDSPEINDEIIYLEEELPDIEYYEIMSFDEISKENPSFIAFSKKEIYNELYDFFENANKTNNFIDLFYNVVEKKEFNTNNYVLVSDAERKKFYENDDEEEDGLFDFINSFKKINKYKDNIFSKNEKNKLFFTINYDENSDLVRFKPFYKTNLEINNTDEKYVLLETDDTNVPVKEIYYSTPKSIANDYLSDKVLSYLKHKKNINKIEVSSDSILEELNKAKPSIDIIIENLKSEELLESDNLDYTTLLLLLEKYDFNFNNIDQDEQDNLVFILTNILNKLKEEKYDFKSVKSKLINIVNHKYLFYDKVNNIFKLLKFTDDTIIENENIIDKLEDEKNGLDNPDLLFNNIYDISKAIYNEDIDINLIIENIKNIMNRQILENVIINIKNYNSNNIDDIEAIYNKIKSDFDNMKFFKDNNNLETSKFINFSSEIIEVKEANELSNYIHNPTYNINEITEDYVDLDNKEDLDEVENIDLNMTQYTVNLFDKYINIYKFQDAIGFKELLKIILPILSNLHDKSKLDIDYNYISNELFQYFAGVPTKCFMIKDKIKENNIEISDELIKNISNISFKTVLNDLDNIKASISYFVSDNLNKITDIVIEINTEYLAIIKDAIYNSIAIWILNVQNAILDGTHLHNYNYNHIHLWSDNGYPIDKSKKIGVTIYLCDIITNFFESQEELNFFKIDIKIIDIITNIIEKKYKDILDNLIKIAEVNDFSKINKNKGKSYQVDLVDNLNKFKTNKTLLLKDKMLYNYVNALIYMPGINYNRIHKYLLGCCLQKIDEDFLPDSDLKNKRNDLIAAKNYFSKNRVNYKKLEYMFMPIKDDIEDSDDENIDIDDYYELNKLTYNIDNNDDTISTYDKWFENINKKDNNKIFTENNYLNIYKNGSSEYIKIIKNYIQIMQKTINSKKNQFSNNYIDNIDIVNFKQLINNTSQILSKYYYSNLKDNPNYEDKIIQNCLSDIKVFSNEYDNLNKIYTETNKTDIIRAKAYITIKIMCLPFNPDIILGEKMYIQNDDVEQKNYLDIFKNIFDSSNKILINCKIPTFEENLNFINRMREEFKNKKLDVFDKQTEEQRKVFNELNKIGIRVENLEIDYDETNQVNPEINNDDNFFVLNGENEFMLKESDNYNDDYLDNYENGHIYS